MKITNFFRIIGAVLVIFGVAYYLNTVSIEEARQNIRDFVEWVNTQGWHGLFAFICIHAFAVAICFPATIAFEWGAGIVYGVLKGVLVVLCSKTLGGCIGFILGKYFLHDWIAKLVAKSDRWRFVFDSIGNDGLKFALLLKLSPAPSWLAKPNSPCISYGLSLTPLKFYQFALATVVGSLPFIVNNVYTGTIGGTLAGVSQQGSSSGSNNTIRTIQMVVGGVSVILISRKITQYVTKALPTPEEEKKKKQ